MDATLTSIISISIILAGTTLGSLFVFFLRKVNDKLSSIILGVSGGIMTAAAFFGLIYPSILESAKSYPQWASWIPPLVGFILGGLLLWGLDKLTPHMHIVGGEEEGRNGKKNLSNEMKFFLAVTIHNIPEGLSVGFAAGLAIANPDKPEYIWAVLALAIGIAIQNVPEGLAVSVPLFSKGMSKGKSFLLGFLSGVVEPIAAVIGLFIASNSGVVTPWLLSFAGGAMLYVILDELIPESRKKGFEHFALWSFMIGFAIMMVLEVVFSQISF